MLCLPQMGHDVAGKYVLNYFAGFKFSALYFWPFLKMGQTMAILNSSLLVILQIRIDCTLSAGTLKNSTAINMGTNRRWTLEAIHKSINLNHLLT